MIPTKHYERMKDFAVEDLETRTTESAGALTAYQERIGWPWEASQEQLEDWNLWMAGLVKT